MRTAFLLPEGWEVHEDRLDTPPQRVVRAFVSSTFHDMHAERDHLVTVVFPELRERLELLNLEFFDVDLRWGVPKLGIDGELANPWEYCKHSIENVEPFFIAVLGERYGSVLPSKKHPDGEDEPQNQSVTEREIRHAVLSGRLRKRSYFYFRASPVPPDAAPDVYARFVDVAYRTELKSLKQEIVGSRRPVRHYSCGWTGSGFEGLEEFGRVVLEDLWSGVLRDERYVSKQAWSDALGDHPDRHRLYADDSRPVPEAIWQQVVKAAKPRPADPLQLEAEAMARFAESRLRWFQGRRDELNALGDYVQGDLIEQASRPCIVTGDPGAGKSALMARFATEASRSRHFVFSHFVGATEQSANLHWLLERLNRELDRAGFPASAEDFGADLRKMLSERLRTHADPRKIIIIIDGVDQLRDGLNLLWLPTRLGTGVRVILSTARAAPDLPNSPGNQVAAAIEQRARQVCRITVNPLGSECIRNVVIEFLKEYCKKLDPDDINRISQMGQARNPLYLMVMLNELRTLGGDKMRELVSPLIGQLRAERPDAVLLFDWVLERLEVFGREAVAAWCMYLNLGRAGMASRELRELLSRRFGEDAASAASRIERGLRPYLLRRGRLLDFHHDQLARAVERRYAREQDVVQRHAEIARYFLERHRQDEHALSELPFHLFSANLAEELYEIVGNDDFRERKIALRNSVYDVCADIRLAFDLAVEREEIAKIARFGFMHAGYSEGRFTRFEILKLHREQPALAKREVDLLRDRPRFRLLILLALKELEAGQAVLADDYVQEALRIANVKPAEADHLFVAGAAATLLKGSCSSAARLLRKVLPLERATKEAARIAVQLPTACQILLLEQAIEWLKENAEAVASGPDCLEAFDAVVRSIVQVRDRQSRDALLEQADEFVKAIKPAVGPEDVLGRIIAGIFGKGRGLKEAAASILASASHLHPRRDASAGRDARPPADAVTAQERDMERLLIFEQAVAGAEVPGFAPYAFAAIAAALARTGSPETLPLFRALLARTGGENQAASLRQILESLAESENPPAAVAMLEATERVIMASNAKQRSLLALPLARAYAAHGKMEPARRHAPTFSSMELRLYAQNPLMAAEQRFNLIAQQVEVEHITKSARRWRRHRQLKRMRRWLKGIDDEKTRLAKLRDYVGLCAKLQDAGAAEEALDIVAIFRDEELGADALSAIVEVGNQLGEKSGAKIRQAARAKIELLPGEELRCKVLIRWLQTASRKEMAQILAQNPGHLDIAAPALRSDVLACLAGALHRHQFGPEALAAWMQAAAADQKAGAPSAFMARVCAATRSPDADAWADVLAAVTCPDLETARESVEAAANACGDGARLRQLERRVRKVDEGGLKGSDRQKMLDALARAWARLGDVKRGSRLAHSSGDPRTVRYLLGDRAGLGLLLKNLAEHLPSRIEEWTECVFATPEEGWRRQAFRELFIRVSRIDDRGFDAWNRAGAAAILARWLALWGQPEPARQLLARATTFSPRSKDWELYRPHGRAAAMLEIARARAALGETDEAGDQLLHVVREAGDVSAVIFRAKACSVAIEAWIELRRINRRHADLAQPIVDSIVKTAVREIPAGMGDKYKPLAALAIGWADLGDMQRAVAVTESIVSEEQREDVLIELMRRARSWDESIQIWDRIFSASARRRAASVVADKQLRLSLPTKPTPLPRAFDRQTFRYSLLLSETLPGILVFALVPVLCYGLLYLSYPFPYLWAPPAGLAVLLSWKSIWRETENFVRRKRKLGRAVACLAGILFLPVLWGAYLARRTVDRGGVRFRLWRFLATLPPDPGAVSAIRWEATSDTRGYLRFLRCALYDSTAFDRLLAPLLYCTSDQAEVARMLDTLPPLRLPREMSASRRRALKHLAEARRSERLDTRLRAQLRAGAGRLRLLVTMAVVLPAGVVQAWFVHRSILRAHRLHVEANALLDQGKAQDAIPLIKRALRLNSDDALCWNSYAIALARDRQVEESVKASHAAIEKAAGGAHEFVCWYSLAATLFDAHRYAEAMEPFQRVTETAPHGHELYRSAARGIGYCKTNLGM